MTTLKIASSKRSDLWREDSGARSMNSKRLQSISEAAGDGPADRAAATGRGSQLAAATQRSSARRVARLGAGTQQDHDDGLHYHRPRKRSTSGAIGLRRDGLAHVRSLGCGINRHEFRQPIRQRRCRALFSDGIGGPDYRHRLVDAPANLARATAAARRSASARASSSPRPRSHTRTPTS